MIYRDWQAVLPQLIQFRRKIHAAPEIAMEEVKTAKAVQEFAATIGFDEVQTVGNPGLIFSIYPERYKEPKKAGIMFRAELDALPIPDTAEVEYRSKIEGKGHLCGHDGHMTMLLGLMYTVQQLKMRSLLKEPVHFVFQPAEENGAGAKAMLEDVAFDYEPKHIFSLHNIPGAPLGQVLHKADVFTPEVISVDFEIEGSTSHSAQPHLGKNPAPLIAEIIAYMRRMHSYKPTSKVSTFSDGDVIVAPVQIQMGQPDYGISAGKALVGYTFRTYRPTHLEQIKVDVLEQAKKWEQDFGLSIKLSWHQYFAANINDLGTADLVKGAIMKAGLDLKEMESPFEWGEDFGNFTQKIPACMFGIGSGEEVPPLHNQTYDFPDALIPYGVKAFLSIVLAYNTLKMEEIIKEIQADG